MRRSKSWKRGSLLKGSSRGSHLLFKSDIANLRAARVYKGFLAAEIEQMRAYEKLWVD